MSLRHLACGLACVAVALVAAAPSADAQVVVYGRPVVAAPMMVAPVVAAPAYVSNYVPAGNYAAVTAFSPPVVAAPATVAVRTAYAPVIASPMAVAAPTVTYYAPAVAETVVAAPVTAYYAPAAVAVPVYRRGLFGGYRPTRTAYLLPY